MTQITYTDILTSSFGSLSNAGTLTVPASNSITVPSDVTVTNSGTIDLSGTLDGVGTITNTGTIQVETGATVTDTGQGPTGTSLLVTNDNYTLDFDTAGGTGTTPASIQAYAPTLGDAGLTLPAGPTPPAGEKFTGWWTAATGGTHITDTTDLTTTLPAGPTTATLYAQYKVATVTTTTSLHASPSPAIIGGKVTYTATVSPAPDSATVAFTDGTTVIPGCSAVPVTSTGTAACTTTYTATGSHSVTAIFSGDAGYQTSTSSPVTEQVGYEQKVLASGGYTTPFGSVITATVRITNSTGTNESGSQTTLHATALDGKPIHGAISTRTSNFPYDPWFRAYTFLAAGFPGLTPGTHTLTYTASGDPTTHTIAIQIHRL